MKIDITSGTIDSRAVLLPGKKLSRALKNALDHYIEGYYGAPYDLKDDIYISEDENLSYVYVNRGSFLLTHSYFIIYVYHP